MLPLLPNPAIASILVSGNYAQKGISLVSPGLREGKIGGPIPEQLWKAVTKILQLMEQILLQFDITIWWVFLFVLAAVYSPSQLHVA